MLVNPAWIFDRAVIEEETRMMTPWVEKKWSHVTLGVSSNTSPFLWSSPASFCSMVPAQADEKDERTWTWIGIGFKTSMNDKDEEEISPFHVFSWIRKHLWMWSLFYSKKNILVFSSLEILSHKHASTLQRASMTPTPW